MKTYYAKQELTKEARNAIENALYTHDRFKNSYFWKTPTFASGRRKMEAKFYDENPGFYIETEKGLIEVNPSLSVRCRNVYYSLSIKLDGKSKDIRALKALLK